MKGIPFFSTREWVGPKNPGWKGGRERTHYGYIRVYAPDHPHNHRNMMLEHRLVMEQMLGRLLERHEVVHHINGVRDDNRPENLKLYASNSQHIQDHEPLCYCNPLNTATHRQCSTCKIVKPLTPEFFHRRAGNKYGFRYYCRACRKVSSAKRWREQHPHD